jgi:hypothetical protein
MRTVSHTTARGPLPTTSRYLSRAQTGRIIFGVNAYHGDVASAVVPGGAVASAIEEGRFQRVEHWGGFPWRACGLPEPWEPEDLSEAITEARGAVARAVPRTW